ncbi:ABC transporter substrate-binding protein [Aeromicrobium marinum]|uniref:ABC transporter substrate-binding protein n=1 Tax=Aeromicrobium marinum TaxID=219314 RepID=UPI0006837D7C|nr:ABC transporter substrate-binding protein [Aeromicrobium marinum]
MKTRLLTAAAALTLFSVAACGSSTDDAGAGDAAWTFTDDLGTTLELDAEPERIVAQVSMAAALADLGIESVATFGPLVGADGEVDPQAAGLDPEAVTDVTGGGEYGDIDVETLVGLRPDLVITSTYIEPTLWYVNEATAERMADLPLLVQSFEDRSLTEILDGTEEIAEALGADLDTDVVQQAHADFDAAADRLRAIGEELGDRQIIAASPATDVLYISNPEVSQDLKYYRDELGLPIVTPTNPDPQGYFETLSWENADTYDADIVLWDARVGEAGLAIFDTQPVWAATTAGSTGAYVPWVSVVPSSYEAQAAVMNQLADDLEQYL